MTTINAGNIHRRYSNPDTYSEILKMNFLKKKKEVT